MTQNVKCKPSLKIAGNLALKEIATNRGVLYDENVVDACLRLHKEKGFKLE